MRTIGVIGGSGLYEMEGLTEVEQVRLDTPFGKPSDEYVTGRFRDHDGGEAKLVFLPRHGRGHRFLPSEINFRANLHGMKQLGVEWIVSVSAVGSMREEIRPGDFVIVDQFYDRTKGRQSSFFGDGIVGHVSVADPVCSDLAKILFDSAQKIFVGKDQRAHQGGTYLCIEGPQFSTRAESRTYRSWGVDVIGMTNVPEYKLAREAEISYATIALATDYDCWHESEEDVTVEAVIAVVKQNVANARAVIREAVSRIPATRTCACKDAAKHAMMTDPKTIPADARKKMELIVGRYL